VLGLVWRIRDVIVGEAWNDRPHMTTSPPLEALFQLLWWDPLRQEGVQRLMLSA
jgi:hypothetical protein